MVEHQVIQEEFGSHRRQYYNLKDGGQSVIAVREKELNTLSSLFRSIFLPEGYPASVSKDYLSYQIWDTLQALCSAVTGVLSTRAILAGYGVGNAEATVSAAAMQWVVKNGSGMIGRILFAWKYGTSLDHNAKTWRLVADILNDFGMALEMISPHFPALFLPLVCTGTIAMSITGVAGGCSRAALTQHFAIRDNLGDVSAKDGSQETAVSLAGMLLGMLVTAILSSEAAGGILTWSLFLMFTICHLFCNYKGLRAVRLDTFNRQRADIFLSSYRKNGKILSPDEVSANETILWIDNSSPKIILGAPITEITNSTKVHLSDLLETYKEEKYLLRYEKGKIQIALQKSASPIDILKAYFHANQLRHLIPQGQKPISALEKESYATINKQFADMIPKLKQMGWNLDRCLLGPSEWRFSFESNKSE
eukprot:Phypoly_transcript_08834.p1 GENE.Phypoly_transcript_08834~~Phypoly_transcript_08834.p1  ORF type:complete len:422 (+),score=62.60 Phypoly_transcript_08834:50-1315(+)